MDSNHDKSLQRALCYHYTTGQTTLRISVHGKGCNVFPLQAFRASRLAICSSGVFTICIKGMSAAKTNSRNGKGDKPLIFVVDDEPMLLELASVILQPLGYTLRTFRDPDSAIKQFADADPRPALIITDYAMHTMNGLDLIEECRRLKPQQKIILVSGTVSQDVYRHSQVKPDLFLAKPYHAKQLVDAVETVLLR